MHSHAQVTSARKRGFTAAGISIVGLLLISTTVIGQKPDTTTRSTPQTPPSDPFKRIGETTWPKKPAMLNPGLPPSSVIEIKASFAALKENVDLMATIDRELLGAVVNPSPDYAMIVTDASDIRRLAVRLLRNLALPRKQNESIRQDAGVTLSVEQLSPLVNKLDSAIQSFLSSPVLTEPRTVDARLLSDAGADLEKIVNRGADLEELAARMATSGGGPKGGKPARASRTVRSRLEPKTSIQLTLECDAWSVSELLDKPSEVKEHGTVNLDVKVQKKDHRLAEELISPIEDCVDGEADEEATANNMQYVAIVKDFTSYEVKGKVFAYQVGYEIGLTKGGQVAKRISRPVWFYYVDESGDGTFELLRRPLQTGLVPDWVKELAGKR